ncbi:D-alanyl-D-alanine carboxypeptidase family protein [Pseudooceanicola batsensis HTCC2597]|uniref:D-alanyl-D-alanine carboxypeptidase family protein n=1 Tax=Pseudooceanicola batsensis (strain ATCC BAA-863 / DSM 15984 / KCTC 12145 / HTCC2597) TaxID=252305 RepID=A3TVK1_PSEBH|nr:D-alanyl-D-alanine carboxypeptidase family protein [Pseudooceanicola batsensis]EAQ03647.1 D-alanyl-D-alanine carboxypeptidase family protein [Pseudooceanicola batsensis HTCC2597]
MVFVANPAMREAQAAPYAAMVMDARSGEVLHSSNADARLHPASLTKMMTLYIAFEAVRNGEITLDTPVRISRNAAAEPPSKLGLAAGSKIKLRYLIRASAVKSANDAATAIGEAIEGSEARFARRMTRTAKALGMTRTTFKNAHGLTESGHLSTARDMTILGRHLLFDYPEYYNLFSRVQTHAGIKKVSNTNRRLLGSYRGADGIKTGYTRAAGFNLVASAERGNERIIATVFGGRSSASRNAKVAELLDLGFKRAPSNAPRIAPAAPVYAAVKTLDHADGKVRAAGKVIRLNTAVTRSLRPQARPGSTTAPVLVAMDDTIESVVAEVAQKASLMPVAAKPAARAEGSDEVMDASAASAANGVITPMARPVGLFNRALAAAVEQAPEVPRVVTRVSTSGGRHWGINIGRYKSHNAAERVLLQTALKETDTLDGALRKVVRRPTGFDANFLGMERERADLACRRLQARNQTCFMIGPS